VLVTEPAAVIDPSSVILELITPLDFLPSKTFESPLVPKPYPLIAPPSSPFALE